MTSLESIINPGSLDDYVAASDQPEDEAFYEYSQQLKSFKTGRARQLGVTADMLHSMSEQEIQSRLNPTLLDQTD